MNELSKHLNYQVVNLLKEHGGGEQFFNALDLLVRSDRNILDSYIKFVKEELDTFIKAGYEFNLILTGKFGNALYNNHKKELEALFKEIYIVNGGLRGDAKVNFFKRELPNAHYIMLDDSFYSGKTMNKIEDELKVLTSNYTNSLQCSIFKTIVIYDGSINVNNKVSSLYRYYNNKEINEVN